MLRKEQRLTSSAIGVTATSSYLTTSSRSQLMTLVEDDRGILSTKFNLGELKDRPKSEKRRGLDFVFILYL